MDHNTADKLEHDFSLPQAGTDKEREDDITNITRAFIHPKYHPPGLDRAQVHTIKAPGLDHAQVHTIKAPGLDRAQVHTIKAGMGPKH